MFDRIVRPDRPLTATLALVWAGLALSPLAGLLAALLADDFRLAFGWTVAVGMLVTAVVIIALLAIATVRRQR